MGTASESVADRRQVISNAIVAELERQAQDGAARIDVAALAKSIDNALTPERPTSEGKRPEDLNATNDD